MAIRLPMRRRCFLVAALRIGSAEKHLSGVSGHGLSLLPRFVVWRGADLLSPRRTRFKTSKHWCGAICPKFVEPPDRGIGFALCAIAAIVTLRRAIRADLR